MIYDKCLKTLSKLSGSDMGAYLLELCTKIAKPSSKNYLWVKKVVPRVVFGKTGSLDLDKEQVFENVRFWNAEPLSKRETVVSCPGSILIGALFLLKKDKRSDQKVPKRRVG